MLLHSYKFTIWCDTLRPRGISAFNVALVMQLHCIVLSVIGFEYMCIRN